MNEMLQWLDVKDNRDFVKAVLGFYEEMDELRTNITDLRDISSRLNLKVAEYQGQIMGLKKDKQALLAFVMDNVKDETELNKIFN